MNLRPLGRSGLEVSEICLGTMTWGSQNDEAEAHRQLDYAVGEGVTFIDTAEAYPTTPATEANLGSTEEYIGSWLARRGRRDDLVIATKVAGKGNSLIRDGAPISRAGIRQAIEGSLRRLRTDYVDLYQLHWPNRGSYHFRQSWAFDPSQQDGEQARAEIAEAMQALGELVAEGKARHVGLSNETAWGTAQYLAAAEREGLPRIASIQNEYSLLHRIFDLDLAEVCIHEGVGLLAYSPLATGILTGKYSGGVIPPGSRATILPGLRGRYNPIALEAADAYAALAREAGLDPAQMALAFCLTRPFITSAIIGATSLEQLKTNIGAARVRLGDDVMAGIAKLHRSYPIPM